MIWLLIKANWMPVVIVVAVITAISVVYIKGHSDGTAETRAANIKANLEQLNQRSATDATVKNMSPAARCTAIGGVLTDGQCL